jgi:hypothetical protein
MKTKAKEKEAKPGRFVKYLDEMNLHRDNAAVMAGLLRYCDPEHIDGELVREAGVMIGDELDELHEWTLRLEKELRSK